MTPYQDPPTPQHQTARQTDRLPKRHKKSSGKLALAIGAVLVLGGGFFLTNWDNTHNLSTAYPTQNPPTHTVSTPPVTPTNQGDNLSQDQIKERKTAFEKIAQFQVETLEYSKAVEFVRTSKEINDNRRAELLNILMRDDQLRLAKVVVWDDVAQDGDIIKLSSLGFTEQIHLMHDPATVFLPIKTATPAQITGIFDGGGGITLGFTANNQAIATPVLAPNQTVDLTLF